MNLHNEIMNLQTRIGSDCGNPRDYNLGHRDARHDAAELSLRYGAIIEAQQILLDRFAVILQWYVDEDEIIEGMEGNEYWVDGKYRAVQILKEYDSERQTKEG